MIIRINLHPAKKQKTKDNPGSVFVIIGIVLAVVIGIVCAILTSRKNDEERDYRSQTAQIESEIKSIKDRISDVTTIQSKIADLRSRELVLAQLTSIRQGPQFVLNEFARLMSNPTDLLERKEATDSGWQLAWDPDSVIIKSFKDIGNGEIQIDGYARSMDDIQEFWTRLKTSELLRNVRLIEIKDRRDSVTSENTQSFIFEMNANFHYQTQAGKDIIDALVKDDDVNNENPEDRKSVV